MFFRTGYNYDVDVVSRETGIVFDVDDAPSLAQQSFKDECDINVIVKRFGLTGELPGDYRAPVSGDFTGITDFQSALNAVIAAESAFMEMPAELRDRFQNDPQRLMAFLDDDKNRDEAIRLGIVPAPKERTRDVVQAVDELAARLTPQA